MKWSQGLRYHEPSDHARFNPSRQCRPPSSPVIVTHARPDPIFEAEAKEYGAVFVAAPLDNPSEFLGQIRIVIDDHRRGQAPVRRWSRKYVAGLLEVNVAQAMARIVDVS